MKKFIFFLILYCISLHAQETTAWVELFFGKYNKLQVAG